MTAPTSILPAGPARRPQNAALPICQLASKFFNPKLPQHRSNKRDEPRKEERGDERPQ